MSGIVWSIGMNGKSGSFLQPYFSSVLLLLGNADSSFISPIVRAPFVTSFTDHFIVMLCLSSEGHLHQIQAYLEFAAPTPVQSEKKFKYAPKNHSIVYSVPSNTMFFEVFYFTSDFFQGFS